MKKFLLLVLSFSLLTAGFSQSEKYVKAMESKIALLDSAKTADEYKDLANSFERIGEAEKTQWLPYYYASYCSVMAGMFSLPMDGGFGDNSAIVDPIADKADKLLKQALGLTSANTETYCVEKMIAGLRMMGNPMARYMTEGPKAETALANAKKANPENPRIYILEGQDKFYTPEQFGGSKEEAKILFEKALSLFEVYKPDSSIAPNWGKATVNYFLSQMK